MYVAKNSNILHLADKLTYWGAFSMEQATYYLEHFYRQENAANLIDNYVRSKNLCYLHGDTNVISISDFTYLKFTEGKEKCIWVFFHYLDAAKRTKQRLNIITKNDFCGVDFTCWNRFHSLVYIAEDDKTYYSVLKTKHDEAKRYIYVVDSKARAREIRRFNNDDVIWVVDHENMYQYEGD